MFYFVWPILVVVFSNVVYNICAKSTPSGVNAFASLSVTYLVSCVCSLVLFALTSKGFDLVGQVKQMNWTSFLLGIAVVGLEAGFLFAYRAGWKINSAQLVANTLVSCILVLVGYFAYREQVNPKQLVGIVMCLAGLVLVAF